MSIPRPLGLLKPAAVVSKGCWKKFSVFRFNPALQAFPPSHLGIVCKHPLLSVCRRLEALEVIRENREIREFRDWGNLNSLRHPYLPLIALNSRYLPLFPGAKQKNSRL